MFAEIPFRWDDATRTPHIGQRNGSYPGMLNNRNFNIVIVNPDTESGDTAALKVTRTVRLRRQCHIGKTSAVLYIFHPS